MKSGLLRAGRASVLLAASLTFATFTAFVLAPASGASTTFEGKVCADTGTGFCLAQSRPVKPGYAVATVPKSESNNWDETELGTVTAGSPFTNQKWDQEFLGDPVLQFAAVPVPSYCVTDPLTQNRVLVSEPCGAGKSQHFVQDGHRLINVAASDHFGNINELSNDQQFVNIGAAVDAAPGSPFTYGDQHWCLDQPGTDCVGP